MEARQLQRLKEEQERALAETDRQLEQWKKFHSDYVALKERLTSLPKKTTHEVMVPFGSMAFMPGQLVHTNEILVLLGDNYFVERSASQAAEIVSRRLKELDRNMQSLQKQRDLLVPRAQFTSDMINTAAERSEQREIMEPFDEEKEAQWRERHKEYLRRAGQARQKERAASRRQAAKESAASDEDLWKRLDQLELQEARRNELRDDDSDDSDPEISREYRKQRGDRRTESSEGDGYTEDNSSSDGCASHTEEEEMEEGEEDVCSTQRVIRFSHTKPPDSEAGVSQSEVSEVAAGHINSPADLYRLVKTTPRSILKKRPSDAGDGQWKTVTFGSSSEMQQSTSALQESGDGFQISGDQLQTSATVKAFQDVVVERPAQPQPSFPSPVDLNSSVLSGASKSQNTASPKRPLSKFQLARQKKT